MRKGFFVVLLFMVALMFFPCGCANAGVNVNRANYSSEYVSTLDNVKSDDEALSKVKEINLVSENVWESEDIQAKLDLVKSCTNAVSLHIDAKGVKVDSSFLNELPKSLRSLWFASVDIDFKNVSNPYVKMVRIDGGNITNYGDIIGFSNVEDISVFSAAGVGLADYENLSHLDSLKLKGVSIDNYGKLFAKLYNIKTLHLTYSNLQDEDTKYFWLLSQLEDLRLLGTYVEDISFLKDLPNLKFLVLPMGVTDLSPIYYLSKLQAIDFDAYTLLNVDEDLLAYFKSKKIDYPKFDLDIVNKVDSIVSGFNFTSKTTDREKVDAVSNYVTNHLEYQNAIGDISIVSSIIYGAGVCNEYALLEYTLLKVVGVDAYFMAGYGDTAVYNRNYFSSVPHAWNMVKIDGTWYGLDVTWIDGVSEYYKDTYYMVKPSTDITWDEYLSDPNKYSDELFGLTHVTYNNPQYNVYEDKNVGEDGYFSKNNGVVQSPTTAIETSAPRYVWGYWVIAGVAVSMLFVILVTIARKEKE